MLGHSVKLCIAQTSGDVSLWETSSFCSEAALMSNNELNFTIRIYEIISKTLASKLSLDYHLMQLVWQGTIAKMKQINLMYYYCNLMY